MCGPQRNVNHHHKTCVSNTQTVGVFTFCHLTQLNCPSLTFSRKVAVRKAAGALWEPRSALAAQLCGVDGELTVEVRRCVLVGGHLSLHGECDLGGEGCLV